MDALTLFISLIITGGVLTFILYPLWRQTRPETAFQPGQAGQTLEEYEARYQAALAAIRDLMFDYEMGKVSAEDYETLLPQAKLEAAKIRRQIDRLSHTTPSEIDPALDAKIETLIAELKREQADGNETLLRAVEAEIESLKNTQLDTETGQPTCPHCGQTFAVGDAFCSGCGHSLASIKTEQNVCPNCGNTFQPDDAFCAKCGVALDNKTAGRS
jgi:DNA-directed RNA polymerase subunit RPC12/RpoP